MRSVVCGDGKAAAFWGGGVGHLKLVGVLCACGEWVVSGCIGRTGWVLAEGVNVSLEVQVLLLLLLLLLLWLA
jgi:hypothetical protein